VKLFLFTGVLCDWTCGSVLVRASSLKDAIESVTKNYEGCIDLDKEYWASAKCEEIPLDGPTEIIHTQWGGS